jgi:hypothetical protein
MDPFARAVFLFYDTDKSGGRGISDAMLWLDLEPKKPKTITVLVFDEHDHVLAVDPKLLNWSGGDNLKVEPAKGKATVRVTLVGGGSGRLQVAIGSHTGEIQVRKKGE